MLEEKKEKEVKRKVGVLERLSPPSSSLRSFSAQEVLSREGGGQAQSSEGDRSQKSFFREGKARTDKTGVRGSTMKEYLVELLHAKPDHIPYHQCIELPWSVSRK